MRSGTSYWDNDARLAGAVAATVVCDRDALARADDEPSAAAWPPAVRPPAEFDAVVDFSSYRRRDTLSALGEFGPRVELYVYISSDSV